MWSMNNGLFARLATTWSRFWVRLGWRVASVAVLSACADSASSGAAPHNGADAGDGGGGLGSGMSLVDGASSNGEASSLVGPWGQLRGSRQCKRDRRLRSVRPRRQDVSAAGAGHSDQMCAGRRAAHDDAHRPARHEHSGCIRSARSSFRVSPEDGHKAFTRSGRSRGKLPLGSVAQNPPSLALTRNL